jgi:hypothetical protein
LVWSLCLLRPRALGRQRDRDSAKQSPPFGACVLLEWRGGVYEELRELALLLRFAPHVSSACRNRSRSWRKWLTAVEISDFTCSGSGTTWSPLPALIALHLYRMDTTHRPAFQKIQYRQENVRLVLRFQCVARCQRTAKGWVALPPTTSSNYPPKVQVIEEATTRKRRPRI